MSAPELILFAIVAVVGIPSARRNPTAAALVGAWAFSEALYLYTGSGLETEYFAFPDCVVIAVIMVKRPHCTFDMPPNWLAEFKCLLFERSPADRFILLTYPVAWFFYVADAAPFYTYWALWLIAVAQFAAAGREALPAFFRRNADAATFPSEKPGSLRLCPAGGLSGW